jgi:hypothetical protein
VGSSSSNSVHSIMVRSKPLVEIRWQQQQGLMLQVPQQEKGVLRQLLLVLQGVSFSSELGLGIYQATSRSSNSSSMGTHTEH